MRLVSMLPSATEIVYALGLDDDLVGVTFECDEPPAARAEKEVLVSGRDTAGMTPAEIDGYVRQRLANGEDLYTLHADALARLQPDLILTQDLCRVCALPSGHVSDALDYLGCSADVLSLDPYSLDDVLGTILAVGERTGTADRAARLVADLRGRLAAVAARVAGRPRPRAAVIEWVDPPFAAGHWIPDLVTAAGGEPVADRRGRRSEALTWPEIAAAEPDLIIVAPCGYHLTGAISQAATVVDALSGVQADAPGDALPADAPAGTLGGAAADARTGSRGGGAAGAPAGTLGGAAGAPAGTLGGAAGAPAGALPAVPVWAIDADSLVVRPGPRLVDGVEAIAAILHPGAVPDPPAGSVALVHSPAGR